MRLHLGTLLGVVMALIVAGPATALAQTPPTAFSPDLHAALQQTIDQHLARNGAPGVLVGVWAPGRGSLVRAQGIGDVANAAALGETDRVRIGSITKTFVATVVLQLADEARLHLDDTLESHVPGIENGDRITIRHLLGMTSGVANFLEDPAFLAAYESDLLMPFSPRAALAISRRQPASFAPGAGFHYSETNYFLLGLIVEQVTGHTMSQAIDERIAQPLGLAATMLPTTPSLPMPFARGYRPAADGTREDVTLANPAVTWTAGAMVSNLQDLHVWTRALATGALLSPAMQAERLQWTAIPGGEPLDARYGLGILSMAGFLGHNGGIPGYSSVALYLPDADASIVVLVNQSTLEGGPADFLFYDLAGQLFPEHFPRL